MTTVVEIPSTTRLESHRRQLLDWVTGSAYPLWAAEGIDAQTGGFVESIGQTGQALPRPRRARVQPRQIYAFAEARTLTWQADTHPILRRGWDYFTAHYRRPDGLFRTLADVDGSPLDDRALLYDQCFALLAYAVAGRELGARDEYEQRALALREAIDKAFRSNGVAFHSDESRRPSYESNPHMHLLEACLEWSQTGRDPSWNEWVRQLSQLAQQRFIRRDSGALGEYFDAAWRPSPGVEGRLIEPGHQFEWAWLLLRSEKFGTDSLRKTALRLIDIGERHGVRGGVAVNALLDDLSIHDPGSRLWPQTERLKAAVLAARLTGDPVYWSMAAEASASLLAYLQTPIAGLWFDLKLPGGEIVDGPAPASTFYHLVAAIVALNQAMQGLPRSQSP
ncbi:MAG: AGE family epimerase/isomerase [Pseudomonadota bacterium]|nr:AGE family epimerase/isomerase [Pseudomonadota bacterium]